MSILPFTLVTMKSLVMLWLALAAAAAREAVAAESAEAGAETGAKDEPLLFYHSALGIEQAARIKQYEQELESGVASRIVGGQPVTVNAHPYMGGIVATLSNGFESMCGCSLLSRTRAITAAHCWWDGESRARQFTVVYGSNRLYSGGTRIKTNKVEVHPDYDFQNLNNDVAIITHAQVTYSRTINRISLTRSNSNFVGQQATAAGYGRIYHNAPVGPNPAEREVTMPVISNEACAAYYIPGIVISSTLCTSFAGGRGTCGGDSSGPLTVGTGNDRVLIGVTSFGPKNGCGDGAPSAFARISSFRSWINQRI
ncbi:hypothetical protein ABMA27_001122 [Loxostege sticticalis]|uniref:Peptidase S1 domain-containing protein n=1 Tax=Loxostege sticticalis TaxID=481309 RepID=A0ABR3I1L2_LOXSC